MIRARTQPESVAGAQGRLERGSLVHIEDLSIENTTGRGGRLSSVSFSSDAGEVIGVLGPNTSGKSTLLKAIAGFVDLSSGIIRSSGKNLAELSTAERQCIISYLPANPVISEALTVTELLQRGREQSGSNRRGWDAEDSHVVKQAIRDMHLQDLLDEEISNLEPEHHQAAWLGMALARGSRILLIDKADSQLDYAQTICHWRRTRKVAKQRGSTVIFATHNLFVAPRVADRLLLLGDAGQVIAYGEPGHVLRKRFVDAAYGVPCEVLQDSAGIPVVVPMVPRDMP